MQIHQTQGTGVHARSTTSVLVAVVAAMMLAGQAPASATHLTVWEVDGRAVGYYANRPDGGERGPAGTTGCDATSTESCSPSVQLASDASNSPQTTTDSDGARAVYGSDVVFESSSMRVSTEGALGASGSVTSSAEASNVRAGPFTADLVSSTCTASESGPTGSTRVVGGRVETSPGTFVDVPEKLSDYTRYEGVTSSGDSFSIAFHVADYPSEDPSLVNIKVYAAQMWMGSGELLIGESYCHVFASDTEPTDLGPPASCNEQQCVWTSGDFTAPDAPLLISPGDGTTTNNSTTAFDWSEVTDPSGVAHELQADNSGSSFPSPEVNQSQLGSSDSSVSLADGTYSWRVRASDGAGNVGAWSTVFILTVNAPPTTPLDLTATSGARSISLTWSASPEPDVTGYDVLP